jgi:hypothetical protein
MLAKVKLVTLGGVLSKILIQFLESMPLFCEQFTELLSQAQHCQVES